MKSNLEKVTGRMFENKNSFFLNKSTASDDIHSIVPSILIVDDEAFN